MRKALISGLIVAATAIAAVQPSLDSSSKTTGKRSFEFLPEMHMSGFLSRYLLQKNDYFTKHYFLGSNVTLEPVWVSYAKLAYFAMVFEINPGMGQKGLDNVLFDPIDINYALMTIFEFRFRPCIVHIGEDHRCFHEIDRKDFPTVYWNMLYLAAATKNYRAPGFYAQCAAENGWALLRRLSLYIRWGVFLKGFFDITIDNNVDYENNRIHEALFEGRYAYFCRQNVVLSVDSKTKAGLWKEKEIDGGERKPYWEQWFGMQAAFCSQNRALMLFANYILDDIPLYRGKPRFSKDQLLEIGVRIFL
jgi:hypothetical protein